MSYTSVFGGTAIYPSDVSFLEFTLTADTAFEWPLEAQGTTPVLARIMDVTATAASLNLELPDATLTAPGQTILFNNVGATNAFTVRDATGASVANVAPGEQWQAYLTDNTTEGGEWRVFRFGASTATVQPSALAGFGLTATASTLSQEWPVTTFSTSGLTLGSSARAGAYVWTGTGIGTLIVPQPTAVAAAFFFAVRNSGGGTLTLQPPGVSRIDGATSLALQPGESTILLTDGTEWYTLGLGQETVFAFDHTVINLTGNYTLATSELNRISYKFTGNLTADATVTVPATVQQYWIDNATTGPGNLRVQVQGGGTPLLIPKGASSIYYSDGVNFVRAADPTTIATPIGIGDGGTGATTASAARLNLGITPFADQIVTATDGPTVRTIILAARSGANSDITSLSGLTTPLSVAQGGTGSASAAGARTNLGLGSMATQNANAVAITGGSITGLTALGVTGTVTLNGDLTATGNIRGTTVGVDPLAYLAMGSGNPVLTFDTNDFLSYDRTANIGGAYIAGLAALTWTSTGVNVTALRVTDANFNMSVAGGVATTAYDVGDFTSYDRTTNTYAWTVGNVVRANLSGTGVFNAAGLQVNGSAVWYAGNFNPATKADVAGQAFTGGISAPTISAPEMYVDGTYTLYIASGAPILRFDTNDYLRYDRTSNFLEMLVGGVQQASITSGGVITARVGVMIAGNVAWHAGNFNPANYAALASSPTFTGTVLAKPVGAGGAAIVAGGATVSGYLALYRADGVRRGYIGNVIDGATSNIEYQNESGGSHVFNSRAFIYSECVPRSSRYNTFGVLITDGTAAPSGGGDGDLYFQYT